MTTPESKFIEKKVIICNRCRGAGILSEDIDPVGQTFCACKFCKGSGRRLIIITTETIPYEPEVVE